MRTLLLFIIIALCFFSFTKLTAQTQITKLQSLKSVEKTEKIVSSNDNTFYYLISVDYRHKNLKTLIDYIEDLGCKVIGTCSSESLIYVKTNEKFKNHTELFKLIENQFSKFKAICKLEMNEVSIVKFNKCNNEKITIKLNN